MKSVNKRITKVYANNSMTFSSIETELQKVATKYGREVFVKDVKLFLKDMNVPLLILWEDPKNAETFY